MFRSYLGELRDLNNISGPTHRGLVGGGVMGALGSLVLDSSASGSPLKQYVNQLFNSSDDAYSLLFTTFLGGASGHYISPYLRKPRG